jgi:hypothetical protein
MCAYICIYVYIYMRGDLLGELAHATMEAEKFHDMHAICKLEILEYWYYGSVQVQKPQN